MKTHSFLFGATIILCTLAASLQSIHAQTSYTLHLDGIPGDSASSDAGLLLAAWSFGASNSGSASLGGGGGAGKANFQELSVTKAVDSSSPLLLKACATGQHIATAELKGRRRGAREEYFIIKLTDVLVSSVSQGGLSGKPAPTESLSLNFTKIEYIVVKKSGEQVKFEFDLASASAP